MPLAQDLWPKVFFLNGNKLKKKIVLIFLIALGVCLGVYSNDLSQKNPETVFLTTSGIKKYEAFKKIIPEKNTVIFKYELTEKISVKSYKSWDAKIQAIVDEFDEEYDFLLPKDLYTSSKKLELAINQNNFINQQINLIQENFLAIVAIEKSKGSNFHKLIDKIKTATTLKLSAAGIPYTNYLLDNYSLSIKEKVFPLMFAISFIFILFISRSLITSIFLFLPCLFSAVISLSVIKFFYSTMNMVTSIIPLMCFTITLAMVFHLYFTMRETLDFKSALSKKLPPIILMVITTCIGFGSLVVSDIQAINDFGKLSFFLIFITAIYSLVFIWSSESFLLKNKKHNKDFSRFSHYFYKSLKLRTIAIISIIALITGTYFVGKIQIITDATRYFPESSGLKSSIDSVNKSIVGIPLYDIIIDIDDTSLEKIKQISGLEEELKLKLVNFEGFKDILSLNSMIKNANKVYSGDYKIPDQLIAYQTLRSRLKPSIKESFPLSSKYKMSILGSAINVDKYEEGLGIITNFLKQKKIPHQVNGLYYNLMISQKSMITILFKSFLIALLIVSSIALIYLKKARVFFIFLFVNIVPVFVSFTLMYALGFSINIATVMTYSIALGMIVDSSFHLIHNLKDNKTTDFNEYYKTTVIPIIGSSLLLIGSFLLFGFNSFLPIRQFGLNLSIILSLGMFFDLYVLPTLFIGNHHVKEVFDVPNL